LHFKGLREDYKLRSVGDRRLGARDKKKQKKQNSSRKKVFVSGHFIFLPVRWYPHENGNNRI
jgi:hypothetical protein